ncbi:MAG: hypothetical protein AB7S69_14420 [Salinivirgaceae bacterium]
MKKYFLLTIIVIITLIVYSCDNDKFMTNEEYICNGDWTLQQTEKIYYYDDVFDRSEVSINKKNIRIDFQENGVVYYETPDLLEVFQGTWQIDSTGEHLITDLYVTLSSSTGYNGYYLFYPKSKIIEINTSNLIVETIPRTNIYMTGTKQIKVLSYERCICVKK